MEETFYAAVADCADPDDPTLSYTVLILTPKGEFDAGGGKYWRVAEETMNDMLDIFGEGNLAGGLTDYTTFLFADVQNINDVIELADTLATKAGISLVWDHQDFIDRVSDCYTKPYPVR